ncbi:hypothetical protein BGX31_005388 [Mortierella sp. GBA43]|nr:hypothetical protein BGX31_005388 [Mortierella sp. GBA43]
MFDIPELDELICQQLNRHDLTQCVRVNKKWHHVVIPYIWRDIEYVSYFEQREAFRRMVLEDYLHEQRQQEAFKGEHNTEHHTPVPPSSLAKYGAWIRELPGPKSLLSCLEPPCAIQSQELPSEGVKRPSALELLRHLYKYCPFHRVQFLPITKAAFKSEDLLKTLLEYAVPYARELYIGKPYGANMELQKLKHLLDRCSSTLKKLTLEVDIPGTHSNGIISNNGEQDENDCWPQLEELRCLAEAMLNHMPNINELHLGRSRKHTLDLTDDNVAAFLAGSRKGWKTVKIACGVSFGENALAALTKHSGTLEELEACYCHDVSCGVLAKVLASCRNLHTLLTFDHDFGSDNIQFRSQTNKIIDHNPITASVNPWPCEASLKVFEINIAGIPRPDLTGRWVLEEAYPGQGREIQGLMYDRLARFIRLEKLRLGRSSSTTSSSKCPDGKHQYESLEMSLESGLDKLAGLTELEELDVSGMKTRIGLKEVQWMAEHWPRLHTIRGLDNHCEEWPMMRWWLRTYRSKIELRW